ncbi:hypothetical protein [Neptuniibacter sp. QD37_11]|uniref:hypothetical protein n=1 Tax=Neptuniibacter sp. QD37_11 TaxID=3398209 RepID=UPI0039F645BE
MDQPDALSRYLDSKNSFRKLFGDSEILFPMRPRECQSIFLLVANDLSPENLCCDGEISQEEVKRRKHYFQQVWRQLEETMGRTVDLEEVYAWR